MTKTKINGTAARLWALAGLTLLPEASGAADRMTSLAVNPATGVVTLTPRWTIGSGLAGFHYMSQDIGLGGGAAQFYSVKNTVIPPGGDTSAFTAYVSGSGVASDHADLGSKLTPDRYSALTSADPDVGYGPVNLYLIHHKSAGDYFTTIVPRAGFASAVTELKPMDGPGNAATPGASGYFGLTFAAPDLSYGPNQFYYLRRDAVTGFTHMGTLAPALAGSSMDRFNLGVAGHTALAFVAADLGYAANQMYFLRLDPVTSFSIFGTVDPSTGRAWDIANLGGTFSTLTFSAGDLGFGAGRFYTTGETSGAAQSVSFAPLADRTIAAGAFSVSPSASSGLPVELTMVPGTPGAAVISGPTGGVFSVTPTAPGLITLQATQGGQLIPTVYEYNMLRQSFTASGPAVLGITAQPTPQSATEGGSAAFAVAATGTTALSYQWRKTGVAIGGNPSATTATLTLAAVGMSDAANYDVIVTNAAGSIPSGAVGLTVTPPVPVITNSPLTAGGTVGTPFSFSITASGSATSFSATPLPAGLSINPGTGAITGTPSGAGMTSVLLGATNATGTGNATLTITVAAAGVAPSITNSPLTAGGTVGTPFSFSITASGSATSFSATPLPAGLSINAGTGAITGTPSVAGMTSVLLGATNATGTGNATLTLTVAAAGVAPSITNSPLTAGGTVGTPFSFSITASGSATSFSASPLPAGLSINAGTGAITGTPSAVGMTSVLLGATNATGTGNATLTLTVAAAGVAPSITNSPLTAGGTVGTPFSFSITASGSATSFTATPLPAGLSINGGTGTITGTPSAAGVTSVLLGATNATGTGNATLTITVAAAGVAPSITNSPLTAGGTVGTPFSFSITASGSATSFTATTLPAGLSINAGTGAITGTPSAAGMTSVLLGATNATGTGNATLTLTVAAAGVAPSITNSPLTAGGTVGTPFSFSITASGSATGFTATPLPPGLSINAGTGAITGTPSAAGMASVLLGATNATGTGNATLTLTVAAAGVAPSITNSPLTAGGTVGTPFSFSITASGSATSFTATPLPAGLSINAGTGAITGAPSAAGVTSVQLTATNAAGTGRATLTITMSDVPAPEPPPGPTPPGFESGPLTSSATVGALYAFHIISSGSPTLYSARDLPPGLHVDPPSGVITGTPTTTGTFAVTIGATNDAGTSTAVLTILVRPRGEIPTITSATSAAGVAGAKFPTYVILASGLPTSYEAVGLPVGLRLDPSSGRIEGTPSVAGIFPVTLRATSLIGTGSAILVVTIVAPPSPTSSWIVNFSARAGGLGNESLIVGFVVSGNGKNLLIRGAGPSLTPFGLFPVLPDPSLTLYNSRAQPIAANDDWVTNMGGAPNSSLLTAAAGRVGAFAFANDSKDSALLATLDAGAFTISVLRASGAAGLALTEIYDLDADHGTRLVNVSARMNLTRDERLLVTGFVIRGDQTKTVLIRAVGPSLASFAVSGTLADPEIALFSRGAALASNDDWETTPARAIDIAGASSRVGAFPLGRGSKDAALLLTLEPGDYTLHATGVGNTVGVVLIEVYEVP